MVISTSLTSFKDFLQAQLCYQLFITPIHVPLEKQYRDFARIACDYLCNERCETIHFDKPRHHVVHRFSQPKNSLAPKILIAHGWASRAAYMARLIRALHLQGFDVFALDFPAHGEAKGLQLPWTDAVTILHQIINGSGPFYGLIGHSFGGSMILILLSLASQYPEWKINYEPEQVVLMASPTHMRMPVTKIARYFKLSSKGYIMLRDVMRQNAPVDLKRLAFRYYAQNAHTPFLCVHGEQDTAIEPKESILFCQQYPHATLSLLPDVDHVGLLLDERVERIVIKYLTR